MYSRARLHERIQLALVRGLVLFAVAGVAVYGYHAVFLRVVPVPWSIYVGPSALAAVALPVALWPIGANRRPGRGLLAEVMGRAGGVLAGLSLLLALSFFYRGESYSRGTVLLFFPFALLAVPLADRAHQRLSGILMRSSRAGRRVIVIGTGECAKSVGAALADHPAFYSLIGFVPPSDPPDGIDADDGQRLNAPVLGRASDLPQLVRQHGADEVIVAEPSLPEDELLDMIGYCMASGAEWKFVPRMAGMSHQRVRTDEVAGVPVIGQRGSRLVGYNWYAKRAMDLALATVALVVASPLMLLTGLAIKISSGGPVIFRQARVGLGGEPFVLLKFRTMDDGAPVEIHRQYTGDWIFGVESTTDGVHKIGNDPRVTPIGRLIRMLSLDELPQLWNVVRGDMSLVGPRPPLGYEVERYAEWHRRRLTVPPGITGLWQISGRNRLSFEQMVELDIQYLEKWTLWLDFSILLRTVPTVIFDRGK